MVGKPITKDDPRINRKGRPPASKNFTTKVREALEKIAEGREYTQEEAFIKDILKKSIDDEDVTMMRTVWEQLDRMEREEKNSLT